jgi:hypothetical protein
MSADRGAGSAGKLKLAGKSQHGPTEPSVPPTKPDDHQANGGVSRTSEDGFTAGQEPSTPDGTPDKVRRVVQGVVAGLVLGSVMVIGLTRARGQR